MIQVLVVPNGRIEVYMVKTIIFILTLLIFSECPNKSGEQAIENTTIKSPISKIEARLPGKVTDKDDNLLLKITEQGQISQLVNFANDQLAKKTQWQYEVDGVPSPSAPFIGFIFYNRDIYMGQFGIGHKFFSTVDDDSYKVKLATKEERLELLRIAGISESQYDDLYSKRSAGGTWKNK
jgi:hypothetical protein